MSLGRLGPNVAKRLTILHPPGVPTATENPFGKDIANLELFRALARHGGFEQLDVLSLRGADAGGLAQALLQGQPSATRITSATVLNTALPAASGALLRGQPELAELAWLRRRQVGDRGYSLLGLVHTIAPPYMRQVIANTVVAPLHPWDAVICTSPSVRDAVAQMLDDWSDHLAERTGGRPPVRARRRAELGLAEDEALVLWVGRLSFFEKAFPQPMFRALQQAAEATGAKVRFAMAGWFPSDADRARYETAARLAAPDVTVQFLDGNDPALLGELWAASDIFLSLVDNIQETFGITPLEAMAAGLPVVASDWDGYRYTMRDGVEAFLIPTLGGPAGGLGQTMVARHALDAESYQTYVGSVAQYTAVHVGRAAEALAALIRDPALRRRMGEAGRARVAAAFDWPVVIGRYHELLDELAQIRAAAPDVRPRHAANPVKGDPFAAFAGFATQAVGLERRLRVPPGVTPAAVLATEAIELDQAFGYWRATLAECAEVVRLVADGRATTLREVLLAFPQDRRRVVELGVMWLAKQGFLDWL